jgi:Tol biopolymer transport system component
MKIEINKQIIKHGLFFLSIFIFLLSSFSPVNANRVTQDTPPTFQGVIAYIERDGDIYLQIGETNQIIQLTFDANEHYYSTPRFSPNGQFLGFLKTDNQKGETTYDLHIMDLETRKTIRLAENVDDWGNYDWAPDSKSIAFGYSIEQACHDYELTEPFGIWEVSLETNEMKEIVSPSSPNAPMKKPEYSFNGKFLSFETYPCFSAGFNVGIMDISNGETFMIGSREYDWSPHQNTIISSNDVTGGGNGELSIISPNQSVEDNLLESNKYFIADPHWSPDGKWIALRLHTVSEGMYIYSDETTEWEDKLVILDVESSQTQEICTGEEIWGCKFISWSPDGNQFVYQDKNQPQIDWYLYSLDSNQKYYFPEFGESDLDWMSFNLLPQSFLPTPEPTNQEVIIEPITEIHPESTQAVEMEETTTNRIPLILGLGLIVLSIIFAIILFVLKQSKNYSK